MTLTAMLLAGGQSRRMGRDKATLPIAGEPLWARQLGVLRALQSEDLWLSARDSPVWCPSDIEVVLDSPPSRGPLSGLVAAFRRLETSHLLVLAVDLPQMTTEHLGGLWAMAKPGCGVVPVRDNRFEPLCAIYPAEAAAIAEAAIKGEDVSLQNFVQTLQREFLIQPHPLSGEEGQLYLNLNSPEDLPEEGENP